MVKDGDDPLDAKKSEVKLTFRTSLGSIALDVVMFPGSIKEEIDLKWEK